MCYVSCEKVVKSGLLMGRPSSVFLGTGGDWDLALLLTSKFSLRGGLCETVRFTLASAPAFRLSDLFLNGEGMEGNFPLRFPGFFSSCSLVRRFRTSASAALPRLGRTPVPSVSSLSTLWARGGRARRPALLGVIVRLRRWSLLRDRGGVATEETVRGVLRTVGEVGGGGVGVCGCVRAILGDFRTAAWA